MEKRIAGLSKADKNLLMRTFKVGERAFYKALSFSSQSALALRLRRAALEKGGKVMVTIPECETIHDANGMMIQTFANGAVIEVDKNSGNAVVKYQDKVKARKQNLTIKELYILQEYAAAF